ncbi:MAG: alpha/beta fold hydrolase [Rhodobacterales bacterium]|nr:alpha/beta fold hydrolase [Rhodobacterales bacterium]
MEPDRLPQDWPFRAQGRSVRAGAHRWWVIDTGPHEAPAVLLLHGLGASGHSFARLIPALAEGFRVIVPDLPGQGCTRAGAPGRLGLDPMAEDLLALCTALGAPPQAVVGHSAGAALALRLAEMTPLRAVVGINAALGTFDGAAGWVFPLMARALSVAPFAAHAAAALWGRPSAVDRLLRDTGSQVDSAFRAAYLRLVQDPAHVAGALGMMAAWRLEPLLDRMGAIDVPVLLIAGGRDRAVPPEVSQAAAARLPGAQALLLPDLGHLAQEEAADGLADRILPWLAARLQPAGAAPKI